MMLVNQLDNSTVTWVTTNFTSDPGQQPLCTSVTDCIYIFLIPVICVFGIIGNSVSFKVFVFTSFGRRSSRIILAALSLSDTGFLLSLFLTWLGSGQLGHYFSFSLVYCYFVVYVTYVCSFLSVWYIVLLMIERYIVVCHPLNLQMWCTKKRGLIVVIATTVIALLFYSHTFVTSVVRNNECTIASGFIPVVVILTYVDTAITFVLPVITVIILNIIIILNIRKFRKRLVVMVCFQDEKLLTNNLLSVAEIRITRMLIVVSSVFVLTNLPSHAIRLYIMIFGVGSYSEALSQIQLICNLLYFSNFAINFILYSGTSLKFRTFLCLNSSATPSSSRNRNKQCLSHPKINNRYKVLYAKHGSKSST